MKTTTAEAEVAASASAAVTTITTTSTTSKSTESYSTQHYSSSPSSFYNTVLSRASTAWQGSSHSGLPPPSQEEGEHYTFTRHFQPVNTSTYFDIRLQNVANTSQYITGTIGNDTDTAKLEESLKRLSEERCMDQIICVVGKGDHFPHFAQRIFPCWSALLRFPKEMRFLQTSVRPGGNGWNGEILQVFVKEGINFSFVGHRGADQIQFPLKVTTTSMENDKLEVIELTDNSCAWELVVPQDLNTWPLYEESMKRVGLGQERFESNHDNYKVQKRPSRYFSRPSDMALLQQIVLGSSYDGDMFSRPSPSPSKVQILILDREKSRHLEYGEVIVSSLQNSPLGDIINVTHIQEMGGPLYDQALTIHSADIIISPHGAQLTNLAFIKPCTVVAEIFPRGYYATFFQSYVVAGGGISFEGYQDGRSMYFDAVDTEEKQAKRITRRNVTMPVSAASIVQALPEFLLHFGSCRLSFLKD